MCMAETGWLIGGLDERAGLQCEEVGGEGLARWRGLLQGVEDAGWRAAIV